MRIFKRFFISVVCFICLFSANFAADYNYSGFNSDRYDPVDIKTIKISPEKYKNDRIVIQTVYIKLLPTFFKYVEDSGFDPEKYYFMIINPGIFPVMAKKRDFSKIFENLNRGAELKLYGKVKKFRKEPKHKRKPHYYLDLENIEVISNKELDNRKKRLKRLQRKLDRMR